MATGRGNYLTKQTGEYLVAAELSRRGFIATTFTGNVPHYDIIADVLPFGRLWYETPDNAVGYAMHSSRSHDAVIRLYDTAGNVIETHKHAGDFNENELIVFGISTQGRS